MLALPAYQLYSYPRTFTRSITVRGLEPLQQIIEMTLSKRKPSKLKLLYTVAPTPAMELIGVCDRRLADRIWQLGYPFNNLTSVSTPGQLHAMLIAEYDLLKPQSPFEGMRSLRSSLDVHLTSSGNHISPGWLTIRSRASKEYVFHGHVLDEALV